MGTFIPGAPPARKERPLASLLQGQLLLSVLLAEGSALGIYDASLASAVAACVEGALRLAADAGGGGELYTGPLGQLLPHAAKLSYQLVESGGELVPHGEALLVACVRACARA